MPPCWSSSIANTLLERPGRDPILQRLRSRADGKGRAVDNCARRLDAGEVDRIPRDETGDGAGDACRVLEFYRADIAAERYRLGGGTANVERGVGTDIELPVAGDRAGAPRDRPPR